MNHAIVNQYGKYLQDEEYDQVVEAIINNKSSITVNHRKIDIIKHTTNSDGSKGTLVQADMHE